MTLSRGERLGLGLLLVIFTWFTWRGLTMFYSGDDMMNMYKAWDMDAWRLARAQLVISDPVYRPVGGAVYRLFYDAAGFNPHPLYVFCWLLLAANVFVAYYFFRLLTTNAAEALTALSLVLVHGSFSDLYYSAGTIYDRLCFLFTLAALIAYFRFRRRHGWRLFALICLFAILAMGSKESGVALFPALICLECIYFLPGVWKAKTFRPWLRQTAPLFATMAILSLIFVFGRVSHTPDLIATPAYAPRASIAIWLTRVSEYFAILTYRHVSFTAIAVCVLLLSMAAVAIVIRNRPMIFGWLFFVISITPVALIARRPGYVLYLPVLGLGLFFAAAIMRLTAPLARRVPGTGVAVFLLVTIAITWFHLRNWPVPWDPALSPELRLTEQFRRDFPVLPAHSRLLFVSDEFPPAYDLLFNIRLLYRDKSIEVYRLSAPPDQRPDPDHPPVYNHIFAAELGRYVELDRRNPAESIRLNILRGFTVGDEMDIARPDHSAYVVSGLMDGGGNQPSRWTDPRAEFKFRLQGAPVAFNAKFWLPDYVATPAGRTLSVLFNGEEIGRVPLRKPGMNEISLPISSRPAGDDGYTLVEMNVTNPYKDADGVEYGVVLLRAGFGSGH